MKHTQNRIMTFLEPPEDDRATRWLVTMERFTAAKFRRDVERIADSLPSLASTLIAEARR